jgi:hypothetical protein
VSEFISDNCAAFHDEGDVFEHFDVGEWIVSYGDEVGIVAGDEGADIGGAA